MWTFLSTLCHDLGQFTHFLRTEHLHLVVFIDQLQIHLHWKTYQLIIESFIKRSNYFGCDISRFNITQNPNRLYIFTFTSLYHRPSNCYFNVHLSVYFPHLFACVHICLFVPHLSHRYDQFTSFWMKIPYYPINNCILEYILCSKLHRRCMYLSSLSFTILTFICCVRLCLFLLLFLVFRLYERCWYASVHICICICAYTH